MTTQPPNPAYRTLTDGTVYPDPDHLGEVAWRLRYGQPTPSDLRLAASTMEAYRFLVALPQRERNAKCALLRPSSNAPYAKPEEGTS